MSLFEELKRRNVIRMGGLYLVGAWLLVPNAEVRALTFNPGTLQNTLSSSSQSWDPSR